MSFSLVGHSGTVPFSSSHFFLPLIAATHRPLPCPAVPCPESQETINRARRKSTRGGSTFSIMQSARQGTKNQNGPVQRGQGEPGEGEQREAPRGKKSYSEYQAREALGPTAVRRLGRRGTRIEALQHRDGHRQRSSKRGWVHLCLGESGQAARLYRTGSCVCVADRRGRRPFSFDWSSVACRRVLRRRSRANVLTHERGYPMQHPRLSITLLVLAEPT
ncbi:hypothetical protein BCV69DRAFT_115502 [Microstroma glucosiphilum]|uniref:Uncharacterized protein n=1 Tax=Pseudomicrostroma glucosiphilum TaxID=1684307 RepID=A0A316UDR7_9BASI|nr:hypothetical protein BCV69DRAFT_115502 [Pseudomicrostroma glucosiphilum]PWN23312.1 hypothetical protein BCV69DRAFT_115502 [Pseudomicrostroma glucosiphilum]